MSIDNAAPRLGVNRNTLGAYERGERLPDLEFLSRFAAAFDAPFDELVTLRMAAAGIHGIRVVDVSAPRPQGRGELSEAGGEQRAATPAVWSEFALIPRFEIEASAGPGALVERENVVDHMAFRRDWIRQALGVDPARLALITARGDSMEPAIRAGDLLLVDTAVDRFIDDAIYVVAIEGALVVKRIQRYVGGRVAVRSDNPLYPEQLLEPGQAGATRIAGRVRWIGRMI